MSRVAGSNHIAPGASKGEKTDDMNLTEASPVTMSRDAGSDRASLSTREREPVEKP